MIAQWVDAVGVLSRIAGKYPQSAYPGFATSLQAEWQYLCRCTPGAGPHLAPLDDTIRAKLIPALLQQPPGWASDGLRTLLFHGVKFGGMNIQNPVEGANRLFEASEAASGVLVASLLDGTELPSIIHRGQVPEASVTIRKEKMEGEKAVVAGMKEGAPKRTIKRLERIGQCGIWLSIALLKLSGTTLSFDEWMDSSRQRYGLKPLGLCNHCDGCNAAFTVAHALSCKKGGLVSIRHNDARDEAGALAMQALQASKISYEPMINNGRGRNANQGQAKEGTGNQAGAKARGNVLVHGLWETGSGCVLDICISDTDAKSYADKSSKTVLENHAKRKKAKYPQPCSTDGGALHPSSTP